MRLTWLLPLLLGCGHHELLDEATREPSELDASARAQSPVAESRPARPVRVTDLARRGVVLTSVDGGRPLERPADLRETGTKGILHLVPDGADEPPWIAASPTVRFDDLLAELNTVWSRAPTVTFAVLDDGQIRGLDTQSVAPDDFLSDDPYGPVCVVVLPDGYTITMSYLLRQRTPHELGRPGFPVRDSAVPMHRLDRWDTQFLAEEIKRYRPLFPQMRVARLCAGPSVPVGAVLQAAEHIRGSGCTDGREDVCYLVDIELCTEPWSPPLPR